MMKTLFAFLLLTAPALAQQLYFQNDDGRWHEPRPGGINMPDGSFIPKTDAEMRDIDRDVYRRQKELNRRFKAVGLPTGWTAPIGYKGSDPRMLIPCGSVDEGYTAEYQKAVRAGKIDGRYGVNGEYRGLKVLDKLGIPKRQQMDIGPEEFREIIRTKGAPQQSEQAIGFKNKRGELVFPPDPFRDIRELRAENARLREFIRRLEVRLKQLERN